MKIYAAPMEGITGYLFRSVHHQIFSGVERYYMPFLSPGAGSSLTAKEKKDILPANNEGVPVVPQILTNQAELFCGAAEFLEHLGYDEVNLNLGCPSGTVTSKKKGAGFLTDPEALDRFFDSVFEQHRQRFPELKISVKTRLGFESPKEFEVLLPIFNRYPISELTIHPRVRADFYKGLPRMDEFRSALKQLTMPVCFNGNLFSAEETEAFWQEYSCFSGLSAVMIGRGMLASPWITEELSGMVLSEKEALERLRQFHDTLMEHYAAVLWGDRPLLFKMKELWYYMGQHFPDSAKELKKIKKAQSAAEYAAIAESLFTLEHFKKDVKLFFT